MDTMGARLPQFVRDLLASPPRRGGGLNNWLYRVARVLHPYRTPEEIVKILTAATVGEPIKPGEIERAVENSAATAWQPGLPCSKAIARPVWPSVNVEQREAIISGGFGLVDLSEVSSVRFEDSKPHTEEIIDRLFPGNVLLCCGRNNDEFATCSRKQWLGRLAELQLIVPNPMIARTGRKKDGKGMSEHTLDNTGPRRFLVVEQDSGTPDEQAAVLLHLSERAPLVLAVHSGSKSIHGWFMAAGQPEETLHRFMRQAVTLGVDTATWTRCQFVRMPGGLRDNGNRQTVFFYYPEGIR